MRSRRSLLDQVATDAAHGEGLGSIDRATTAEFLEAQDEFPQLRDKPTSLFSDEDIEEEYQLLLLDRLIEQEGS